MQNDRWDAIFACSGAYLNRRLADETEKYAFAFKYEDPAILLEGSFGAWAVVPNGSGLLLHFETPVVRGSATIKSTGKSYRLDGAVPLVQLQLAFIDGANPGQQKNLVFNCDVVGKGPGDKTSGAVTVLNPDTHDRSGLSPLAVDLIKPALAQCFIHNRDKLAFVFAQIDLTPPEHASWLSLRELSYGYQQDEKDELGNFGVMGMFGNVDISGYDRVFDSALLRPEDDFGFILSGAQFMRHILLPNLPRAFRGSSVSEFKMRGSAIVNDGDIHLVPVKVGLICYPPHISSLDMHIENDYVATYLQGRCPITGLVDAYVKFAMSEHEIAAFHPAGQSMSFRASDKRVTHSSHIPWWESVLGILTLGILNVIVGIISLALENAVGSQISHSGLDAAQMGAFQVSWSESVTITFTDGGLQDNFYCRGTLDS